MLVFIKYLIKHEVSSIQTASNSLRPLPINFKHNVKSSNRTAMASSHVKQS